MDYGKEGKGTRDVSLAVCPEEAYQEKQSFFPADKAEDEGRSQKDSIVEKRRNTGKDWLEV